MTTTLNASTSSGLVMTPDNSGNIQLQYNGVTTPTFSVYSNTNQSIPNSTWTKLILNTEEWDTANYFDTTNYRFLPLVAGYYQIVAGVAGGGSSSGNGTALAIYKNGGATKVGCASLYMSGFGQATQATALVYCNGSTDYIEAYAFQATGSSQTTYGSSSSQYMQGCLLRGA
jgi:hypothetical protein